MIEAEKDKIIEELQSDVKFLLNMHNKVAEQVEQLQRDRTNMSRWIAEQARSVSR